MTNDTTTEPRAISARHATGQLKLPAPTLVHVRKTIVRDLRGATTHPDWIPEGLSNELDALRNTHIRLRAQCATELTALDELARRFRREDAEHAERLRQAALDGWPDAAEDERTLDDERDTQREAVLERLWADVEVFAEHCDKVIATIREQERQLLGDLKADVANAQDLRNEAKRLLAEAEKTEWLAHRRGQWVLNTSDDGPFGRQPAPAPAPMPPNFSRALLATSLERPWHRKAAA